MNKAQIIVLSIALAAGGGAFLMMSGSPGPPVQLPVVLAPQVTTDDVLIATRDLSYGTSLKDPDMNWQPWPKNATPKGVVLKGETPTAKEDLIDSFVRVPIANGEPVRRERLVKGATAGLMSTLLPSGKRAVAIDVSLNTTAGGFILPNDRVDVIRTFRDQDATKERGVDVVGSEIILMNVRVLAMGQTVETKNGEAVVTGATATLELDPRQSELVVLAQRTGQLALALRPLVDAIPKDDAAVVPPSDGGDESMTIVRYGIQSSVRGK
jgi:pilus assembly protein CpaB